jgi:hypothetical protein
VSVPGGEVTWQLLSSAHKTSRDGAHEVHLEVRTSSADGRILVTGLLYDKGSPDAHEERELAAGVDPYGAMLEVITRLAADGVPGEPVWDWDALGREWTRDLPTWLHAPASAREADADPRS